MTLQMVFKCGKIRTLIVADMQELSAIVNHHRRHFVPGAELTDWKIL